MGIEDSDQALVIRKVSVIGNLAAGKTALSRKLAKIHNLPLTHVDSVQFRENLQMQPLQQTIETLKQVEQQNFWLIDGYGPLDLIENRFLLSDRVVFIDLPPMVHLWWLTKRQLKSLIFPRAELPRGSREWSWIHWKKLWKTFWVMHRRMRPELIRILNRPDLTRKVIWIRDRRSLNRLAKLGID